MKKRARLFVMLLCCIMVFGMFPITTNAATAETQQPFLFDVDKNVVKGGEAAPGEENFTFELEYGIIGENEQHSVVFTPDDSVTLADCGIAFTNNTITTSGEGEETFTLGGTIDLEKVNVNVAFAMRVIGAKEKDIRKRVPYILQLVGLSHKARSMPNELSGGEQQRVSLARALVNNPKLIVADEPTGNVDPEMSLEIVEMLTKINNNGTTVIMVTHEHNLVKTFQRRVIVIKKFNFFF